MFNDKFRSIGNNIYVFNNFLTQDECELVSSYLDSLDEKSWIVDKYFENTMQRTDSLEILEPFVQRIREILPDNIYLGGSTCASRMLPGYSWGVHADVHDFADVEKAAELYVDGQDFEEKDLSIYGVVIYFNNFEGGEIYYPTQDLVYKQSAGDLVIHGSDNLCQHGVKEVLSGVRYSHSNHIYKKVKVAKGAI